MPYRSQTQLRVGRTGDPDVDEWVTTIHAKALLGCSTGYMYKLGRLGKVRSRKRGEARQYYLRDVQRWIAKRREWKKRIVREGGFAIDQASAALPPPELPPVAQVDPEPAPIVERPVLAGHPDLLLLRHDVLILTGLIQALLDRLDTRPAA